MKRKLYILSLIALIFTSCGEKEMPKTLEDSLCDNDWHSTSLVLDDADIYLDFFEQGTFIIYQKIGEGGHTAYTGTWTLNGNILSGKYSGGEDWAASYAITMHDKFLTLISQNEAAEESVFQTCTIPEEVRLREPYYSY